MSTTHPEYDQSDRPAHPWTVAEPGSWSELAESTAFVFRAGGLALHPLHVLVCLCAALVASWTLPISVESLLPWMGEQGWGATVWAWFRLIWLVTVACVCGVVLCRLVAARSSRAEVWGVLPSMLGSGGLCASTYIATIAGTMLAVWFFVAVGGWIGTAFGAAIAGGFALLGLVVLALSTALLLLAIPAVSANDADAPDAVQRAAAHIIARPGLSLFLVLLVVCGAALFAWMLREAFDAAYATATASWDAGEEGAASGRAPELVWLPMTLILLGVLSIGWAGLTQVLLTLREVVDREDRDSCWDPRRQAAAVHAAVEARAQLARGLADPDAQDDSPARAEAIARADQE